ncbi:MAG: MCE family protein [Deltaproteobacteria bacterium]|nr:MCE family protein [Deltaproteobacteria bacterium]MBN2670114.1 MCE family protein [Deltaproteobacteria bacterium]
MKIYLSYRERVAGLFIIATVVLISLFIVGAAVENLWFTPKVSYHVYVVRGDGLRKGSPVLLSGVEIGEIGDLSIMRDGRVNVELEVLKKHSHRVTASTRAEIRRTMGIGEKRVILYVPPENDPKALALASDAVIPADEPKDLLDLVSTLDLGKYMDTMDKAVTSLDLLLRKLEEEDRMERMVEAFDKLGPTLDVMHSFFTEIHGPMVTLISDPAMLKAFKGGSKLFNDPKTRKLIHVLADTMEPEKIDSMLEKSERLIVSLDKMLQEDGHMARTLSGADRLLNDGKLDRMMTSIESFTTDKKLERLLHNMSVLSVQMAKIGPQIPKMTEEMNATMRELTIVLKALQKTWLLDDETEEVLKKMNKK